MVMKYIEMEVFENKKLIFWVKSKKLEFQGKNCNKIEKEENLFLKLFLQTGICLN